jgi:hypothetical protein
MENFKFHRNLINMTGTLHKDIRILWQYLAHFFLELEIFQT